MFQKVFEYAGPHKKGLYAATAVVLVSVLMGVLPFVLAYQVIAPLVMGAAITPNTASTPPTVPNQFFVMASTITAAFVSSIPFSWKK